MTGEVPEPGPQGLKDPLCVLPLGLLGWWVARGGMGSSPSPLILGRAATRSLGHQPPSLQRGDLSPHREHLAWELRGLPALCFSSSFTVAS